MKCFMSESNKKYDVQGNILDDNCVIDSLEAMKLKGSSITEQVAETEEIINIVDEATNPYPPLAKACS